MMKNLKMMLLLFESFVAHKLTSFAELHFFKDGLKALNIRILIQKSKK